MIRHARRGLLAATIACGLAAPEAWAAVPPQSPVQQKSYRHADMTYKISLQPASELGGDLGARIQQDIAALGVGGDSAFYDSRAGRLTSFILSEPLIPGTGVGNTLQWPSGVSGRDEDAVKEIAAAAVRAYLQEHQAQLRVDVAELGAPRVTVVEDAAIVQLHFPRVVAGIAVRDANVTAVLNHGNLVLLGWDRWADVARAQFPAVSESQAQDKIAQHVAPFALESVDKGALEYIPLAKDGAYFFRLAWAVPVGVVGDHGSWEGLVDAATGELIAFEDKNHYSRRVIGGVYPISNDQRPPDGVEQIGWPMPFADISGGAGFTNANGLISCAVAGARTTALNGQFVRMQDVCGAISESGTNDIDLASGPTAAATDCQVPAGHSVGDTKSSRSGFYELNRIKEQARGYLPTNTWLQGQLPSNMNINNTCNAFWSTGAGTVNFYRDNGSICRNTGEIAAIFDHEWGHGMDANGTAGGVSNPGEGIADIHAFLRLQSSCVGRGFWKNQVCTGYGDQCDGTIATGCTGIREMDFMLRRCNQPHTVTYVTSGFTSAQCGGTGAAGACPGGPGPCGGAVHCEGSVSGETAFDLARRDLVAAPFNLDANTAHELTTRLYMIGSGPVTAWYTCSVGGGCAATGGYLNILAVDDDNGNLNDGTPHMTAIRAAFARHEIHCATPAPVNAGCATGPALPPALTVTTPGLENASLTWTPVPNAANYNVYRTEGVFGCNFGKIKIGTVSGTSFNDTGLLGGRPVSYMVLPVGTNPACFGPASNCNTVTPVADPCPVVADYSLSCSPSSMTVPTGGAGNSSCTVQSLNAFSQSVALTCNNLPAGATCTYVPPAVTPAPNGTAASALTVNVGAAVPAGTYNFTAQGTSGALIRTFPMTLTVVVPNFALTCNPASLTVNQNSSGNSSCTVQSQNAFSAAVTMSCVGLPAGATCAYVPPTLTPAPNGTASSALTVSVGGTVAPGTYNFQARGVSGTITQNFNMTLIVTSFSVAPQALSVDGGGNGVYQPNELALVTPTWRNTGASAIPLTGVLSNHTGPTGPTYSIVDSAASYGTIAVGGNAACTDCYIVQNTVTNRPQVHWDSTALETVSPSASTKTWTLHIGNSFTDVPHTNPFFRFVETLLHNGVTGGCTATTYCPTASTTRAQMAVFVLVSKEGPAYSPPACVAGQEDFGDVPASSPFCKWIEELATRGVVAGCGGGNYCPSNPVTREQMAIFVLRTLDPALNPPACVAPNLFADVPETSPFCRWIEELANRGVVTGCGGGNYCPAASVTREQMGVFLSQTFGLVLYGL